MAVAIRPAEARDVEAVDALFRDCFPREDEARLVARLAAEGDLVLLLIAEDGDGLGGAVAFSRMSVDVDGAPVAALALAPLAVAASHRRTGIAEALVRAGLDRLRQAGLGLVFVLGDPDYYRRFGFDPAIAEGFASPYAGPYFMGLSLQGPMPMGARGRADHAPAFATLSEAG